MKKLYTTRRKIKYSRRRQLKLEQRRLVSNEKKRRRNQNKFANSRNIKRSTQRRSRKSSLAHEQHIVIPKRLDPMDSSGKTVDVCDQIRKCVEDGHNLNIDMSQMEEFTLAGVICLVACINSRPEDSENKRKLTVKGNFPNDPSVASEFVESGFFQGFKVNGRDLPSPKASWTRAEERKVASKKATDLIESVKSSVGIPKQQKNAIWQNLVECMTNTNNHAKGRTTDETREVSTEKWFAGIMCEDNVAHFAFVDLGVGICDSAQAKSFLKRVGHSLIGYGNEMLVHDAFEGKLGSSTGEKGRGLGLPRMKHNAQRGLLQELQVRTGRVIGDVNNMNFQKTKGNFRGTIITWSAFSDGDQ